MNSDMFHHKQVDSIEGVAFKNCFVKLIPVTVGNRCQNMQIMISESAYLIVACL
jgi:hypothetical protein